MDTGLGTRGNDPSGGYRAIQNLSRPQFLHVEWE